MEKIILKEKKNGERERGGFIICHIFDKFIADEGRVRLPAKAR